MFFRPNPPVTVLNSISPSLLGLIKSVKLVAFDFDGVFTDNSVFVDETGTEHVRCSRYDGIGLKKLKEVGVKSLIVSSEVNPVVSRRAEKLEIECIQGCLDKVVVLSNLLGERSLSFEEVAYVGNDINDISILERVGVPIAVSDSHPDVFPSACLVTSTRGGYGAVREVCDLISFAQSHDCSIVR